MTEASDTSKFRDILGWPLVMIILIGCATIASLVIFGKQDLLGIASFITSIASIFIGVYLRQVSKDTNGNLSKRDAKIEDLQRQLNALHNVRTTETAQLAQQVPPNASLPSTLTADPYAPAADAFSGPTVSVPTVQRT